MKKARPPARWLSLEGGDSIVTGIAKHKIDGHLEAMMERGFHVETEPTDKGYRIKVILSPNDRPKKRHLRLVKNE